MLLEAQRFDFKIILSFSGGIFFDIYLSSVFAQILYDIVYSDKFGYVHKHNSFINMKKRQKFY